jgi:hypothetical protein
MGIVWLKHAWYFDLFLVSDRCNYVELIAEWIFWEALVSEGIMILNVIISETFRWN